MNTASFLRYGLQVEPLTPIHVGCDQTLEPYEYDLVQDGKTGYLVVFDLTAVLASLTAPQRLEFGRISQQSDFVALRRWLRKHADPSRQVRFRIRVPPMPYQEILRNIDNPARLGEIHLFTRDAATGKPYLPGSSIKGAIRTAIVDALAREPPHRMQSLEAIAHQAHRDRRAGVPFEAAALGHAKHNGKPDLYRDPLRQIAISDVPLPESESWIDRIQIIRQHSQSTRDPRGIVIYRDLIGPDSGKPSFAVRAELRWHHRLGDRQQMANSALPHRLDAKAICRWCNAFYRPRLEEEVRKFVRDAELANCLRSVAEAMGEDECLIRLGRHSHFECVTVGAPFHQAPKRGFGKSRSYAGGRLPLGWMLIRLVPVA